MTVKRSGSKFKLVSKTGKTLGAHDSRAGAERQERAINISKARASGAKIPRKKGK